MKRTLWAALICMVAGCGNGALGDIEGETDSWVDDGTEVEDGEPAPNDDVGETVDSADPTPGYDPCLDDDICADDPDDGGGDPDSGDGGAPPEGTSGQYQPGDLLLVLRYAPLRKAPNNAAGLEDIHAGHGVHEGHPRGYVPPGQRVVVLDEPRTNGFYRVTYRNSAGWLSGKKLAPVDESVHPVKFARRAAVRDAFFMHQIKRSKWNKDGPLSSANCAPTSLAMAAKIFDLATPGRTIERGIHEARNSYGATADEGDGTSRAEIREGARNLGFEVHELGTNLASAQAEMDRLDTQLGFKRVVVLEGQPYGSDGAAYRSRMTAAFHDAGVSRTYTFQGRHSILVVSQLDNGEYLVADPISEVGMVTMSRAQLKSFIKYWGGTGNALHL